MIMELLGKSLETLFQICKKKFDIGTVCHIGMQMLKRVKELHGERIIHRDIKPENFLIGITDATKNKIFVIDFGVSKWYKSSSGSHIPFRDGI
jgi:serine/threonine protein kinase